MKELLGDGGLEAAIAAAIALVKARPTDAESRYRLFALLAFSGDLHRARRQLEALGVGDEQLERSKAVYINLLAAEQERRAIFDHGADPLLPPDPPEHLQLRLAAARDLKEGATAEAAAKIEKSIEALPSCEGTLNGQPFTALRDLDDVLGSVLEVFAGGRCAWLPMERIRKLEIDPPAHLLDLLWIPARLTDVRGVESAVHLPVLYHGSHLAEDERAGLGLVTDWVDQGEEILRGRGQRLLAWAPAEGDAQELGLLEVRSLEVAGD